MNEEKKKKQKKTHNYQSNITLLSVTWKYSLSDIIIIIIIPRVFSSLSSLSASFKLIHSLTSFRHCYFYLRLMD